MNTNMREVTTLSKALALIIFIAMPFVGGWIGYRMAPVQVIEVEKVVSVVADTPAPLALTTERYIGTIDGVEVLFEQKDYTAYRLTRGGVVTVGDMNTERGYGDDIDATVYVLDWQKPEAEQTVFVRLTGESTLHPLTPTRERVDTEALVRMNDPVTLSCTSGASITASFAPGAVYLELSDGRAAIVPQTISASGARYAIGDESFVFWNKGNTAFIEEGGTMTYTDCATKE